MTPAVWGWIVLYPGEGCSAPWRMLAHPGLDCQMPAAPAPPPAHLQPLSHAPLAPPPPAREGVAIVPMRAPMMIRASDGRGPASPHLCLHLTPASSTGPRWHTARGGAVLGEPSPSLQGVHPRSETSEPTNSFHRVKPSPGGWAFWLGSGTQRPHARLPSMGPCSPGQVHSPWLARDSTTAAHTALRSRALGSSCCLQSPPPPWTPHRLS